MADPRQTFAFDVGAPVQGSIDPGGGYRASNVQGGQSVSGDRSAAALGTQADFGAQLGDYFDKLTKPAQERAARQRFVKGMTDQMYAEAGHEIRSGNGILTKIFGPTDYEAGAILYEGQNRVAEAMQEWSSREDELKKLPKDKVAQEWAGLLERTNTGDPFLDDMISQDMLKQSAPMLQSVAKANYKYGQELVVKSQQRAWSQKAVAFQAQAQQFFDTSDPTEEQSAGFEAGLQSYLDSFQPPAGQEEESYRKSLGSAFRMMIRQGAGHAATALMQRGVLDMLPEDERVRAEDQYYTFANRAAGETAPQFMNDIDLLQGKMEFGQLTGAEAVKEMSRINDKIKRFNGFDADYFDTADQENAVKGVWSARRRALEKQEDRAYQAEREDAREARQDQREQMKAAVEAQNGVTAYTSQNPAAAVAGGAATDSALSAAIYQGFQNNDFAGMLRSYKSGKTAKEVTSFIQNTVAATVNTGYTKEFDGLHTKFEGMMKVNPTLAKEYFGDQYPKMLQYRKLLTSQSPQTAFTQAFGDDVQYAVDNPTTAAAKKRITKWVNNEATPGFFARNIGGAQELNASGKAALVNLIGRDVAVDSKFAGADLSNETVMKTAYDRARGNGSFEQYGNLGWTNRVGTTPLRSIMGMQQQEADLVVQAVIDHRLKAVGYPDGAGGEEYQITRGRYNGEGQTIVVPVIDGALDGSKTVVIRDEAFKFAATRYKQLRTEDGAKPKSNRPGILGLGGPGGDFITGN